MALWHLTLGASTGLSMQIACLNFAVLTFSVLHKGGGASVAVLLGVYLKRPITSGYFGLLPVMLPVLIQPDCLAPRSHGISVYTWGAHRVLCARCAKSRLFFTTGSHRSQGPQFCTLQPMLPMLVHQGFLVFVWCLPRVPGC